MRVETVLPRLGVMAPVLNPGSPDPEPTLHCTALERMSSERRRKNEDLYTLLIRSPSRKLSHLAKNS